MISQGAFYCDEVFSERSIVRAKESRSGSQRVDSFGCPCGRGQALELVRRRLEIGA